MKIASVATPVILADGRAQLTQMQATAQNTDISGLISLDLADWQANGHFVMTAAPRKSAPNAERPVMTVTARGPLTAAKRTVDVTSLVNWSTQRAIELETRRLDDAEKERKRVESLVDSIRRQRQPETAKQPDATPPGPAAEGGSAAPGADRRPHPASGPVAAPGP
ncbi:MAG: hypothetical protein FWD12_15945 [Alphaproteobacteria bacterium]|nr:hypothetical protein [Alphaproteobacteria bacterium]